MEPCEVVTVESDGEAETGFTSDRRRAEVINIRTMPLLSGTVLPRDSVYLEDSVSSASIFVLTSRPRRPRGESDFCDYLRTKQQEGRFSQALSDGVRRVWDLLVETLGEKLILPVAGPTADDGIELAWTVGHRHLGIDVYENEWDWFYRDRATGETDGGDVTSHSFLPNDLRRRLYSVFGTQSIAR